MQAKRLKKKAREIIHGKLEEQYQKLVQYKTQLRKTNSDTTVAIMKETDKEGF